MKHFHHPFRIISFIGIIACVCVPTHTEHQPTFTLEEIMADDGHIKNVLMIAAMIKECAASGDTYAALGACMAVKAGYTPNAPLDLAADRAYAQREIRLLHNQCIKPLQAALREEIKRDAATQTFLEERITECQQAIETFKAFLSKKYSQS